jgi:signal transduction histidine kinase
VVVVDEIHLQQVILNLLRNAMEAIDLATGAGLPRAIDVAIALNACDEVQVEVADSGGGIAEGDLERVFESFYSTKSSGLGVGLAICRKLIEAHGGALWAAHNPGGGALFRFTLPMAP